MLDPVSPDPASGCAAPAAAARPLYAEIFGCQMNKLDAQIALERLLDGDFRQVESAAEAEVILFFTCAVRQHAEDRFFSRLGAYARVKARRPGLVLAVCGCIAEEHGASLLERFPFLDVVCGTRHFHRLAELIDEARPGNPIAEIGEEEVSYARRRNLSARPAQAYVAAMRGCGLRCTYCIVPFVRGAEASRPPGEIRREVEELVAQGVKEVTLLGQTVNAYGRTLDPPESLADLLRLLGSIPGLERLRFVTSHPRFMSDDLIAAMAEVPAVCPGLHLPAQSGSNRILRRMARGYTREQYLDRVERCRAEIAGFSIAGDFIVGFPGESEEDFAETESLAREVRYQNLFIFKYSARPGTPAARLADDVPLAVKEERNRRLLDLQESIALDLYRGSIGAAVEVLVEGRSARNAERQTGRTRTGQIVLFPAGAEPGELREVRIASATALALYGELVPRPGDDDDGR